MNDVVKLNYLLFKLNYQPFQIKLLTFLELNY